MTTDDNATGLRELLEQERVRLRAMGLALGDFGRLAGAREDETAAEAIQRVVAERDQERAGFRFAEKQNALLRAERDKAEVKLSDIGYGEEGPDSWRCDQATQEHMRGLIAEAADLRARLARAEQERDDVLVQRDEARRNDGNGIQRQVELSKMLRGMARRVREVRDGVRGPWHPNWHAAWKREQSQAADLRARLARAEQEADRLETVRRKAVREWMDTDRGHRRLRAEVVGDLHALADRDEVTTGDIHSLADEIEGADWLGNQPAEPDQKIRVNPALRARVQTGPCNTIAAQPAEPPRPITRTLHVTTTREVPEGHTDHRVRYQFEGESWEGWIINTGIVDGVHEAYVMRDDGKRWVVLAENLTDIDAAPATGPAPAAQPEPPGEPRTEADPRCVRCGCHLSSHHKLHCEGRLGDCLCLGGFEDDPDYELTAGDEAARAENAEWDAKRAGRVSDTKEDDTDGK